MILNLDKWPRESVAAIDSQGNSLTYGRLRDFAEKAKELMTHRSLLFLLVENNCGGIAWTIGIICAGNVPLILNAHLDAGLYQRHCRICGFGPRRTGSGRPVPQRI